MEFPPPKGGDLDQDEAYFHLVDDGDRSKIRFHDYPSIYRRPGLYEQLFYDRLKCQSPSKVAGVLSQAVTKVNERPSELRVLDLGAGNGMAAEALASVGVSRLVGADIIPEARAAAFRDRPSIYDHYYVTDLSDLDGPVRDELLAWSFNCLVCVAALGFGDIPPLAVGAALGLIERNGWIAFNIKESFLDASDDSGFSVFVRELIFSEDLDLFHLERYRHRLSIDGRPLSYFAIVGKKSGDELPPSVRSMLDAPG
ncbi:MAG: methyltransferase domain-containing protein [Longimicrobiales bacterium]|nr:methyltransferase domain-containing protein [Longimicrobiales bacterium]